MKDLCGDWMSPSLISSSRHTVHNLGSKALNHVNVVFRGGYNLHFLMKPVILCSLIDYKARRFQHEIPVILKWK